MKTCQLLKKTQVSEAIANAMAGYSQISRE